MPILVIFMPKGIYELTTFCLNMGLTPHPLLNNVKKLQDWYRAASLKQILARSTLIKSTKQRLNRVDKANQCNDRSKI